MIRKSPEMTRTLTKPAARCRQMFTKPLLAAMSLAASVCLSSSVYAADDVESATDVSQSDSSRAEMSVVEFVDSMIQQGYACLLYTSPSPRDQRGSRMPSSA